MNFLLKNIIDHPKFIDDNQQRTAHFLAIIIKAGALAAGLVLIVAVIAGFKITFIVTLALFITLLIALFLVYKKQILFSSILTILASLVTMIVTSYVGDGIHDISILLLPGIIILASYLLNRKIFVIFTIISLAALGLVRLLRDMSGIMPVGDPNFYTEFIIATCILLVIAIGIKVLFNNLMATIELSRKNEQKYRQIFENIQDVYFEINREGIIKELSPGVKNLLGHSREELLNQSLNTVFTRKGNFDTFLGKIIPKKKISNYEVELRPKKGRHKTVSINAMLIENDTPDHNMIVGSVRDVTEKKALEEQLFQSQKLDSIGKLAGGIAHDFNNLLTVIGGHTEIALDKKENYEQNLLAIRSASMKAAGLTKQLLAFSRKQLYQPLIINPNTIISELEKMFRRVIGEDIEIHLDLKKSLNTRIKADPTQLEQIILNLLVNARDAIKQKKEPETEKIITIKTDRVELNREYVTSNAESYEGVFFILSVGDTGIGMDDEIQKNIFEPFFTTKEQGTGLGLSTVYGIVKQSAGFINVYSEKDVGTTIKIYWPVTDEDYAKPEIKIDKMKLHGEEHILLVEDDSQVREFTKIILENYGYTVYVAEDGVAGKFCFQEKKANISLLITDMIMPKMNGIELARIIQKENGEIKVLYISGYSDDHLLQSDLLDKTLNFLQKPFTSKEFLMKIRNILDNH